MNKWPTITVASGVAITIAMQELFHEGTQPHTVHDIEILDPTIGRLAMTAETSGSPIHYTPVMDNPRRPIPRNDVRYEAGVQPTPFPLRVL